MLAFLSILLRRKKAIMIATLAGFAASVVISLVLPPKYISTAAFIPGGVEQELAGSNSFLSRLGAFSESYATFIRVSRNFILDYVIRSRRMADLMDRKFDLREMYGKDTLEEARKELSRKTYVNVRDEGVIEVSVEAPGPVLARDMAAAYLAFTDSLLSVLVSENAGSKVRHLEDMLERGERERAEADSVISEFMQAHGLFEIEAQARAAFQVIGELTARLSMLEVTRSMMSTELSGEYPEVRKIDLEISMLREEIARTAAEGDRGDLFPALSDMPGLATRYLGMVAERMAQEFTLAFIRLKLEDARITSASSVGVIRVIDQPAVPERRAWPKRKQIVIVLTMASLLWTCFVILLRERSSRAAGEPGGSGPADDRAEDAD
jgi:capsule polysaccharide export protein KpsE/RkpR